MVKKNYLANPKKMHFMSTPENLKYTKDHEWVAIDGNLATIGITHYAQHELGDIVYVDINTVGKKLAAEEIDLVWNFISSRLFDTEVGNAKEKVRFNV